MRVSAHPLVVAAALGLLGPAALAEDEPGECRLAGRWVRVDGDPSPLPLAPRIEVIPVEDRVFLAGEGSGGAWERLPDGGARQELAQADGSPAVRELRVRDDRLEVHVSVGGRTWRLVYARED